MSFNTVYSSIIDYKCHVNNDISIMTFNIQSLNSKFNELKELVYTLNCNNCEPDIICLQELWQFPMEAEFLLPGYKPLIYKLRRGNTQGGGVRIYVKKDIDYFTNNFCKFKLLVLFVENNNRKANLPRLEFRRAQNLNTKCVVLQLKLRFGSAH